MSPCTPTDVMEKQLAFIGRASLLSSAGTGKTAFKFPFWHFCGDTLVKIIKVNPDKNATHELSITETMWSLESSRALKKKTKKNPERFWDLRWRWNTRKRSGIIRATESETTACLLMQCYYL